MIKQVHDDIYSFNVDMPQTALKQLNIYVIKTPERNVIFDTGYNLPETKKQLLAGIAELGLKIEDLDLVLTHLHADHTGLAGLFAEAGCKIYAGRVDGNFVQQMVTMEYWEMIDRLQEGYSRSGKLVALDENPGFAFKSDDTFDFIPLEIGQDFVVGPYTFKVLDLIGHTPGHIGLYEEDHRFIFSADTVLDPISPNITYWGPEYPDILNAYIKTLRKLQALGLKQMFATHRKIIDNPNERMDEIIHHHHLRLQEILDAMTEDKDYSVEELSSRITWRVKIDKWEDFPKSQKFFATGETMAHLDYLAHSGHVAMKQEDYTFLFRKLIDTVESV